VRPLVGVLGAGGEVGRATSRLLAAAGVADLRLGARRPAGPGGVAADAGDRGSLDRFCAGCRVVVNCAASASPRELVAAAALAAGADYVDPAGDGPLLARLRELAGAHPGRRALVATGASPGVSGLLPRWLAGRGFDRPLALTGYAWAMDRFSPGSALDFLASLDADQGDARAVWRGGTRVAQGVAPLARAVLPFFSAPVAAFPYLSAETEAVAGRLGLRDVRWYTAFDADGEMHAALPRLRDALAKGAEPAGVAAELARVADRDLFGRRPLHQFVVQVDGESAGERRSRVAVLHAAGTYELTGAVAALAVEALLEGAVPAGAGFAAEVLDPGWVERLRGSPAVIAFHELEGPIDAYAEVEQGVL
jgi:hypothetical protein